SQLFLGSLAIPYFVSIPENGTRKTDKMNKIRSIQALNKRELENGIPPEASWHADYRDTAFVYFGGLPSELSEGDIIIIFSQYGEPVFIKLARDKETGKSRGFGWLKYEDQRSTDLAVDNLGGATVLGRMLHVDHARYKPRDDDDPEEGKVDWKSMLRMQGKSADTEESSGDEEGEREMERPVLREERELAKLMAEHDEDDPMKAFLIEEKKKEVKEAREKHDKKSRREKDRDKDRHRHRKHRSRRHDNDDEESRMRDKREDRRRRDSPDAIEKPRTRESPDARDSRRRAYDCRKDTEEEGSRSRDPYAEERDRRRREKERRVEDPDDEDDQSRDRRKRRKEDDDSIDRRRHRDEKRHHRDRRRSRSRSP
ncbi:hypothetical protein jhhlp_004181, partial [Lomentospora prolificans]